MYLLCWRHLKTKRLPLSVSLLKLPTLILMSPSLTRKPWLDLRLMNERKLSILTCHHSTRTRHGSWSRHLPTEMSSPPNGCARRNWIERTSPTIQGMTCIQWFHSDRRIDFEETHAPSARFGFIRMVISMATYLGLQLKQIHVAFLNPTMKEKLFVVIPGLRSFLTHATTTTTLDASPPSEWVSWPAGLSPLEWEFKPQSDKDGLLVCRSLSLSLQ